MNKKPAVAVVAETVDANEMKVILIDHDDSFTHILAQYVAMITGEMPYILNHKKASLSVIKKHSPTHIILSPGPGNPKKKKDFAIGSVILINFNIPILGVCLGHQGICAYFGAEIKKTTPMHGKKSLITHNKKGLFKNIPSPFTAMRYHSLIAENLPDELESTAFAGSEIMAVQHKTRPIFGVQFHPESIGTEYGLKIIKNFFDTFPA